MSENIYDPELAPDSTLKRLFELAPLPYHSIDQHGCILNVNQAWLRMLGYERSDVIGHPIIEFISPGYRPQFKNNFALLSRGKDIHNKVMEMLRANGTIVTIEADVASGFSETKEAGCSYALLRDISDQPSESRAPQNLARRHALILNAAPGAIIGFDENRKVTFSNPATEEITGWGPQDLQGIDVHRQLHKKQKDGNPTTIEECAICQAISRQCTEQGEVWFTRKDGTGFPAEFQTQPYFIDGIYSGGVLSFTDITERQKSLSELRRSEEKFRQLFKTAPVALWLEDFSKVKNFIDRLQDSGITNFNAHFLAHPDDLFECITLIKIVAVNDATLNLHGAKNQSELTANLAKTMTDDAISVFRQEIVALIEGRSGTKAITTLKTLKGEPRRVMMNVFRDMSRENWDTCYLAFTDLSETQ